MQVLQPCLPIQVLWLCLPMLVFWLHRVLWLHLNSLHVRQVGPWMALHDDPTAARQNHHLPPQICPLMGLQSMTASGSMTALGVHPLVLASHFTGHWTTVVTHPGIAPTSHALTLSTCWLITPVIPNWGGQLSCHVSAIGNTWPMNSRPIAMTWSGWPLPNSMGVWMGCQN
jgi:hypothetical protein